MSLSKSDYYNGIPKCIQYKRLADKGDFNNPFYLTHKTTGKGIVGSVYDIIGGLWYLRIISYDEHTGVLLGRPTLCPEQEPMEFVAIPISDGIKGMSRFGDSSDADNLKRLTKLANL